MNRLLVPILFLILVSWLFGGAYWYSKNYCGTSSSGVNSTIPSLSITDGAFAIQATETFSFPKSGASITYNKDTENSIEQLANYLITNNNRQLTLSGIYNPNEQNKTNAENLGIARADAIKAKLLSYDVPTDNIIIKSLKVDQTNFAGDKLYGGVHFNFSDRSIDKQVAVTDNNEKTSISETISSDGPTPLNIYFGNKQYKFNATPELENYANTVREFLKENSDTKVYVIGHSDNGGNESTINRMAKYRSRKVRDFFVREGISLSKIKISHEGASNPIGSNDTEEGRKKNRRVEVRVK